MTTQTIEMTGERLAAMDDNGMAVYCTPGAHETYWSNRANFVDDKCVATVEDFLSEAGYDELDDSLMEEVFTLEVELIPSSR